MSPLVIFLISICVFILLVFVGMPVAFSFGIVGFVGLLLLKGLRTAFAILGSSPLTNASDINLIAVPLFILMGQITYHSGISGDLFKAAYRWLGRFPGGLALATNVASTGFAACTGSALASGATMASIAYPEMKKFNYDDRLATGAIAAGGTLGVLIPPSIPFIVYGFLTQISIGELFIAGIIPGFMLSVMLLALISMMCARDSKLGPRGESFTWKEKLVSLNGIWGMVLLFVVVIGGLYFGVFAPSEAGAAGAFGAFLIGLIKRRLSLQILFDALKQSLQITCMILTIVIGAMIFSTFVAASGFTAMFDSWIGSLNVPAPAVVIAILLIYIPAGMLLGAIPMVLLTVPVVSPVVQNLGFDLIWFGVLVVIMAEVAFISPPVGMVAYIVNGVTKVPLHEVFRGILPFIFIMLLCVALLFAFPQISLFLPKLVR